MANVNISMPIKNFFFWLILVLNINNTKNATIPVRAHMYLTFELNILQTTLTLYICLVTVYNKPGTVNYEMLAL